MAAQVPRILRAREGAVALILAAVFAALAGLVALVYDLGRAWNLGTELQTAVDAAALAGAGQLDGRPEARARAVLAATGELARNHQIFASASGPGPVTFEGAFPCPGEGCAMINENLRFLAELAPRVDARGDAEARFLEVTVARRVGLPFAALIGAPEEVSARARAVAGWERFACGHAALLMCNPDEPPGNRDPRFPFEVARHLGQGISLVRNPSGPRAPGDFAWLAPVTCDAASDTCLAIRGARALGDALGRVVPPQACLEAALDRQPGAVVLAAESVNMRLDIYPRRAAAGLAHDPDYQPSPNFLTGLVADPAAVQSTPLLDPETGEPLADPETGQPIVVETLAACDFHPAGGQGALGAPEHPFLGPGRHPPHGGEPLDHLGYPRDNCAYPLADGGAPPDNCVFVTDEGATVARGSPLGTGVWDLEAYMAHHHPGVAFAAVRFNECPAGGCALGSDGGVDLDGNGRLGRWEVYVWERRGHPPRFGRPQCFGGGTAPLPQPPAGGPVVADRRLLGALVANCRAIEANPGGAGEPLPLAGIDPAVNLFLSEALGELAPDAVYAEIVAPAAAGEVAALRLRRRIVLHE